MSPAQLFHFPHALKRGRTNTPTERDRLLEGRDNQAYHSASEIHAEGHYTRNRLLKNRAKKNKPSASFSDAPTQSMFRPARDSGPPRLPELHLRGSSILLHEEAIEDAETTSIHSTNYLRGCASSLSLRSHYDALKAPLAISQQTSDSSRRDFVLRHGTPTFSQSPSPDIDMLRPRHLTPSRLREETDTGFMSIPRPSTSTGRSQLSTPDHSFMSSDWGPTSTTSSTSRLTISRSDSSSKTPTDAPMIRTGRSPIPVMESTTHFKNSLLHPMDPLFLKVNVRRPKAAVEHWFDNLDDEISEEEGSDTPKANESHISAEVLNQSDPERGMFSHQSGTFYRHRKHENLEFSTRPQKQNTTFPLPRNPVSESPLQSNVLHAPRSQMSSGSRQRRLHSASRRRSKALNKANLRKDSVLDLSSSDDEEEACIQPKQPPEATSAWPTLRDSIARNSFADSEIEIGTAQTMSTHRPHASSDASQVRILSVIKSFSPSEEPQTATPYRQNLHVSIIPPNRPTEEQNEHDDLLASFPATPTDSPISHRASNRCSTVFSDSGSTDGRRLVSVTKQEETLLAALRLRKIALDQGLSVQDQLDVISEIEIDRRIRPSVDTRDVDLQFQPDPEYSRSNRSSMINQRWSLNGDVSGFYPRASSTILAAGASYNPSRLSRATLQNDVSNAPSVRSSILSERGIDLQAPRSRFSWNTADRRASTNTFVSTSSNGHPHYSRRFVGGSQATLDRLSKVPKRDEIPSQEFINWPYNGWEARSELGVAH